MKKLIKGKPNQPHCQFVVGYKGTEEMLCNKNSIGQFGQGQSATSLCASHFEYCQKIYRIPKEEIKIKE